jgi:murein L,D-transpeptidase YafK
MRMLPKKYHTGSIRLKRFWAPFVTKAVRTVLFSCFLFLSLFMFLSAGKVCGATGEEKNSDMGRTVPASLFYMDLGADSYAILVEKQTQKLFLYGYVDENIQLIKKYTCSTGENSGDKRKRGDKKTPEGIYFFNQVFEDDELSPRYGVRAFVLDYPNSFDSLKGKGGRGIWLHGTNKTLTPNDSRGCIALNNQDILEVSQYISLYSTPIIILEKIEYLSLEVMEEKGRQLKAFMDRWHNSWKNKDLASYMSCYSKDFKSKGMGWQQWKAYKNRLNKKYSKISVTIDGVQGFRHNGYDLVTFRQDYSSESLKSKGIKRLYLREDDEKLSIFRELWSPLRGGYLLAKEKPPVKTIAVKQQDDLKTEIARVNAFIEKWRGHWESKELAKYMECYAKDFRDGEMDREGWEKLKNGLNQKYKNIKVNIINAEITLKEENREAEVSFLQHYQSDRHGDKGSKRLFLRKEQGGWRIVRENWEPL